MTGVALQMGITELMLAAVTISFCICAYRLGSAKGHPIFACDHLLQIDSKR